MADQDSFAIKSEAHLEQRLSRIEPSQKSTGRQAEGSIFVENTLQILVMGSRSGQGLLSVVKVEYPSIDSLLPALVAVAIAGGSNLAIRYRKKAASKVLSPG